MKIGIVSNWCNRGQGIMARQFRSIFDDAGHETFILARPTNERSPMGGVVDTRDVWQGEKIRFASTFAIPLTEYVSWANDTGVEVVFFDMCMQYEELIALRKMGIRTIGRFVWERFRIKDVSKIKQAFDTVYSLTHCEKNVYKKHGIESPYARYGIYPDLIDGGENKKQDAIYFLFHGGLQGVRKPIEITLRAFKRVKNPDIRLIIKSQAVHRRSEQVAVDDDPRISHVVDDMNAEEYRKLCTSCHVCLAPARWEGLGVHLYESLGFGIPVISNNIPPINEVVTHNESGLLTKNIFLKEKGNGLKIYDPDENDLQRCIERLTNQDVLSEMTESTKEAAKKFNWNNTVEDYLSLAHGTLDN